MDCEGNFDRPRRIGPDTQQMARISEIRPTDIMLGRGPTFYNNPGNMVFRALLQEHAIRYRYEASRRDKTEMITLMISQLEAKGCRFLHLSATGAWIEAPSRMIIRKVGHGLRDARTAVPRSGGTVTVIPKKARRAIAKKNHADQVMPVLCGEAETKDEKSAFTNVITLDTVTAQCDASATKLQQILKHSMDSSSASAVHLVQGGKIMNSVADTGQKLVDECMPSSPSELLCLAPRQSPLVEGEEEEDEETEKAGLSFFDREIQEIFAHWDRAGHINSRTELSLAHHSSSIAFDIKGGLEVEHHSEPSEVWHFDMGAISGSAVAPLDAHVEDDVGMVLKMDTGLACDESFDDCLVEYQSQSVDCAVHDGQSLCRWFRNLS